MFKRLTIEIPTKNHILLSTGHLLRSSIDTAFQNVLFCFFSTSSLFLDCLVQARLTTLPRAMFKGSQVEFMHYSTHWRMCCPWLPVHAAYYSESTIISLKLEAIQLPPWRSQQESVCSQIRFLGQYLVHNYPPGSIGFN